MTERSINSHSSLAILELDRIGISMNFPSPSTSCLFQNASCIILCIILWLLHHLQKPNRYSTTESCPTQAHIWLSDFSRYWEGRRYANIRFFTWGAGDTPVSRSCQKHRCVQNSEGYAEVTSANQNPADAADVVSDLWDLHWPVCFMGVRKDRQTAALAISCISAKGTGADSYLCWRNQKTAHIIPPPVAALPYISPQMDSHISISNWYASCWRWSDDVF